MDFGGCLFHASVDPLLIRYGEALFGPKPNGILVRAERIGCILNRVTVMDLDAPKNPLCLGSSREAETAFRNVS